MRLAIISLYSAMFLLALSTATMASSIVINEVELNPSQGGADWVELFNSGNESVDISGWTATITDGSWVGNFPPVLNGTIIEAGGFFVFNGLTSWNHDNGGYATLYTASKEKIDETPVRQDLMDNDFTYGRHPDGHDTNTDGDWGLGYATKGRTNNR